MPVFRKGAARTVLPQSNLSPQAQDWRVAQDRAAQNLERSVDANNINRIAADQSQSSTMRVMARQVAALGVAQAALALTVAELNDRSSTLLTMSTVQVSSTSATLGYISNSDTFVLPEVTTSRKYQITISAAMDNVGGGMASIYGGFTVNGRQLGIESYIANTGGATPPAWMGADRGYSGSTVISLTPSSSTADRTIICNVAAQRVATGGTFGCQMSAIRIVMTGLT